MDTDYLKLILSKFRVNASNASFKTISSGYINDTYLVTTPDKYILQRINSEVFQKIEKLQANIDKVAQKLNSHGYTKVEFIKTIDDSTLYKFDNQYWRLMTYIENSRTYNTSSNAEIAFEAGKIIGTFHHGLKGEKVEDYYETIDNFHQLPTRIHQFESALTRADVHLKNKAENEIEFVKSVQSKCNVVYHSELQSRVCHNDTKLNNILFRDQKALCLIDLDTIMKGYFLYDFGDAIRTIVNPAPEDETDVSKIKFSIELFQAFLNGLDKSGLKLSNKEKETLHLGTSLMPFLHGVRALTDYLNGNVYYKVSYLNQNLDRSRSLLHFTKLAIDLEPELKSSIQNILQ